METTGEDRAILNKILTEAFEDDETWSKLPLGYAFIAIRENEDLLNECEVIVLDKQSFSELMEENFKFEYEREDRIPVISWIS